VGREAFGVPIGAPSTDPLWKRARKRADFERTFRGDGISQVCHNCGAFDFCKDTTKTKKGHNCSQWFLKSPR
jgi:hypothetical protein